MYLGIEIGGTKLQLGLGDGNGQLHALWRGAVVPADGADGIRRQIEAAIPQLLTNAKRERGGLKAVGIGFGGPVDDATRTVIKSHQIAGWDGFPLADWIGDLTGLPAVLGNDADVAGLAEALFGAGKGLSPIFYITIGSGIGGGLIINGEIYRGCGRGAAEIGHLRVYLPYYPNEKYYLESYYFGIVEDIASGWAIGAAPPRYHRDLSVYGEPRQSFTAQDVVKAAEAGNFPAAKILADAWDGLAEGIANVITLLCPRRIVIGGGISRIGEKLFFEPLRGKVAERVFKPFAKCYDIVPAALGEEVVVHGALALARKQFLKEPRTK
jgi:glucokinase